LGFCSLSNKLFDTDRVCRRFLCFLDDEAAPWLPGDPHGFGVKRIVVRETGWMLSAAFGFTSCRVGLPWNDVWNSALKNYMETNQF